MQMLQEKIKKTGYSDIDGLLLKKQVMLEQNAQLIKEIENAINFKPDKALSKHENKRNWLNFF